MTKTLYQTLANCRNEEEIKFKFIRFFGLSIDSRKQIDFYTPQILFEFKFDDEFQNIQRRARAFAQSLYYIRRLKYGEDSGVPSQNICIVDKKSAAILPSESLAAYYVKSEQSDRYDWDLAPSTPCKILIADLAAEPVVRNCHVYDFAVEYDAEIFADLIRAQLLRMPERPVVTKNINEDNFYAVFAEWQRRFGVAVDNSHKSSEYFLSDIAEGGSELLGLRRVRFKLGDGTINEKVMPIDDYKHFWGIHERVKDARTLTAIRQKMDRMTAIDFRRFTGEFFTPIEHARKALEYIARVVGKNWWESGEYRLWDMASGTGNLEFTLPAEALQYCYISTLLNDDAAYCKKIYPTATVFQYDYLNDGEEKLPSNLRADLQNPELKWIIFINPPFAAASNFERRTDKVHKFSVSMTAIRELMTANEMGAVSRELFSQFIWRINRDLGNRQTLLGLFSTLKYMTATNDQKLRDKIFDYKFEGGFVFSSKHFQGTKGKFAIGFAVWNLARHIPLTEQSLKFDVFNDKLEKHASKTIKSIPRGNLLNHWIKRPRTTKKFPPFSSALGKTKNVKDIRDRIADGFLASLMCNCNDLMHQGYTALLSGPYVSAGAFSIVPENFEQAMIVHAVRRLPKATWLNDKDQFLRPTKKLPREFISDCVVWSLFAGSNCTSAMRDVEYEGVVYRIKNNLYPFSIDEIGDWQCSVPELFFALEQDEDRFAAKWLQEHELSEEAKAVLDSARPIYREFYAQLIELDRKQFRLEAWDVGWYQVRNALKDADLLTPELLALFRAAFERLGEKLLPQIYSLGFLRDEVTYFD